MAQPVGRTVSLTLAYVAAFGPRLANFPTCGVNSRLGAPLAKLPPDVGMPEPPLGPFGWSGVRSFMLTVRTLWFTIMPEPPLTLAPDGRYLGRRLFLSTWPLI